MIMYASSVLPPIVHCTSRRYWCPLDSPVITDVMILFEDTDGDPVRLVVDVTVPVVRSVMTFDGDDGDPPQAVKSTDNGNTSFHPMI